MTAGRHVPDDQEVTLGLPRRAVQLLMQIAAFNDDFGIRAHVLLKFGDLLGGVADDRLLPHREDWGSSGAKNLDACGGTNERKRRAVSSCPLASIPQGKLRGATTCSSMI